MRLPTLAPRACACVMLLVCHIATAAGQTTHTATTQPTSRPAEPARPTEWWKGRFTAEGQRVDFVVVFRPGLAPGEYTATIDVPVQSVADLPLDDVVFNEREIRFALRSGAALFTAERSDNLIFADGELQQLGRSYRLFMERITAQDAKQVGPPRPQNPQPPFPYAQREVSVRNPTDNVTLAGTLTIPPGAGPHPALLLLSGSGPQDRDATLFAHKPFWVLADHLSRRGIAVLRLDDRGVGGSTGSLNTSTAEDSVSDTLAAVRLLREQPDIDARRIGLLGHSEGGLVAALAATRTSDVGPVVLLATPALPGHEVLTGQKRAHLEALGVPKDEIDRRMDAHARLLACVVGESDEAAIRTAALALVRVESEPAVRAGAMTAEQLEAQTDRVTAQLRLPRMRWFLRYDPRPTLQQLKQPVFALIGTLDLQVLAKDHLPPLRAALAADTNPSVVVKDVHGLNHLLQPAMTGLFSEYGAIEQTIAPAVLDELTNWLRLQFKLE